MYIEDIKWEFVNNRKNLYKAFLSCKKTFGEEELDPYDWWIEDYESTKNSTSPYPYYCLLGFYKNKVVAGISWNIFSVNDFNNAGIGYLWIDKVSNMQLKGIGSFLIKKVENFIADESEKEKRKLGLIFLESNIEVPELKIKSSVGFWKKQNYRQVKDFNYFSPCVKFDEYSGTPILQDVPLEFMIKVFDRKALEKDFFERLVSMFYLDWYSQKKEDFKNIEAFYKANAYIQIKLKKITTSLKGENLKIE